VILPLNKVGFNSKINKAFYLLEQEFERPPTPEEIAQYLDIEVDEVISTLNMGGKHLSMDQPITEGEDGSLIDMLENENAVKTDSKLINNDSLNIELERSLNTLTPRQKEVVTYFFGIGVDHPLSLEDLGEKYNLTRERVRQIKDKAILKLRETSQSNMLRGFLGA
jgi:RNA polymerase primary sigma factor